MFDDGYSQVGQSRNPVRKSWGSCIACSLVTFFCAIVIATTIIGLYFSLQGSDSAPSPSPSQLTNASFQIENILLSSQGVGETPAVEDLDDVIEVMWNGNGTNSFAVQSIVRSTDGLTTTFFGPNSQFVFVVWNSNSTSWNTYYGIGTPPASPFAGRRLFQVEEEGEPNYDDYEQIVAMFVRYMVAFGGRCEDNGDLCGVGGSCVTDESGSLSTCQCDPWHSGPLCITTCSHRGNWTQNEESPDLSYCTCQDTYSGADCSNECNGNGVREFDIVAYFEAVNALCVENGEDPPDCDNDDDDDDDDDDDYDDDNDKNRKKFVKQQWTDLVSSDADSDGDCDNDEEDLALLCQELDESDEHGSNDHGALWHECRNHDHRKRVCRQNKRDKHCPMPPINHSCYVDPTPFYLCDCMCTHDGDTCERECSDHGVLIEADFEGGGEEEPLSLVHRECDCFDPWSGANCAIQCSGHGASQFTAAGATWANANAASACALGTVAAGDPVALAVLEGACPVNSTFVFATHAECACDEGWTHSFEDVPAGFLGTCDVPEECEDPGASCPVGELVEPTVGGCPVGYEASATAGCCVSVPCQFGETIAGGPSGTQCDAHSSTGSAPHCCVCDDPVQLDLITCEGTNYCVNYWSPCEYFPAPFSRRYCALGTTAVGTEVKCDEFGGQWIPTPLLAGLPGKCLRTNGSATCADPSHVQRPCGMDPGGNNVTCCVPDDSVAPPTCPVGETEVADNSVDCPTNFAPVSGSSVCCQEACPTGDVFVASPGACAEAFVSTAITTPVAGVCCTPDECPVVPPTCVAGEVVVADNSVDCPGGYTATGASADTCCVPLCVEGDLWVNQTISDQCPSYTLSVFGTARCCHPVCNRDEVVVGITATSVCPPHTYNVSESEGSMCCAPRECADDEVAASSSDPSVCPTHTSITTPGCCGCDVSVASGECPLASELPLSIGFGRVTGAPVECCIPCPIPAPTCADGELYTSSNIACPDGFVPGAPEGAPSSGLCCVQACPIYDLFVPGPSAECPARYNETSIPEGVCCEIIVCAPASVPSSPTDTNECPLGTNVTTLDSGCCTCIDPVINSCVFLGNLIVEVGFDATGTAIECCIEPLTPSPTPAPTPAPTLPSQYSLSVQFVEQVCETGVVGLDGSFVYRLVVECVDPTDLLFKILPTVAMPYNVTSDGSTFFNAITPSTTTDDFRGLDDCPITCPHDTAFTFGYGSTSDTTFFGLCGDIDSFLHTAPATSSIVLECAELLPGTFAAVTCTASGVTIGQFTTSGNISGSIPVQLSKVGDPRHVEWLHFQSETEATECLPACSIGEFHPPETTCPTITTNGSTDDCCACNVRPVPHQCITDADCSDGLLCSFVDNNNYCVRNTNTGACPLGYEMLATAFDPIIVTATPICVELADMTCANLTTFGLLTEPIQCCDHSCPAGEFEASSCPEHSIDSVQQVGCCVCTVQTPLDGLCDTGSELVQVNTSSVLQECCALTTASPTPAPPAPTLAATPAPTTPAPTASPTPSPTPTPPAPTLAATPAPTTPAPTASPTPSPTPTPPAPTLAATPAPTVFTCPDHEFVASPTCDAPASDSSTSGCCECAVQPVPINCTSDSGLCDASFTCSQITAAGYKVCLRGVPYVGDSGACASVGGLLATEFNPIVNLTEAPAHDAEVCVERIWLGCDIITATGVDVNGVNVSCCSAAPTPAPTTPAPTPAPTDAPTPVPPTPAPTASPTPAPPILTLHAPATDETEVCNATSNGINEWGAALAYVNASTTCTLGDGNVTVTLIDATVDVGCGGTSNTTKTCTVSDACGNAVNTSGTFSTTLGPPVVTVNLTVGELDLTFLCNTTDAGTLLGGLFDTFVGASSLPTECSNAPALIWTHDYVAPTGDLCTQVGDYIVTYTIDNGCATTDVNITWTILALPTDAPTPVPTPAPATPAPPTPAPAPTVAQVCVAADPPQFTCAIDSDCTAQFGGAATVCSPSAFPWGTKSCIFPTGTDDASCTLDEFWFTEGACLQTCEDGLFFKSVGELCCNYL